MKREPGKGIKSWEVTEEVWEVAQEFIPQRKREEGKPYQRKPGAGRKPLSPRKVLEGIFYVLRTGIQWKALPKEYGAASSVHQYFSEWAQAGFFRRLWQEGLIAHDLMKGLGWEWQSADGCMVKAPLAREAVGNNPTDRGKKRNQAEPGSRMEATIRAIVLPHPEGAHRCLDAGYGGAEELIRELGYEPHIRPRGAEKQEKKQNPGYQARRWVVEVCHSWMNRFRKLLVRYEKKQRNYLALLEFSCAIIIWRNLIKVHPGLIPG